MKRGMMVVVGLVLAGAPFVARAETPEDKRYCAFTNGCVQAFALAQSSDDAQIAQGFAMYKDLLAKNPIWGTYLLWEMESRYESLGRLPEAEELSEEMVKLWRKLDSLAGVSRLVYIKAKQIADNPLLSDGEVLSNLPLVADARYLVIKSHTNLPAENVSTWILDLPPGVKRTEIYSLFGLDRVAKAAYPNTPALADRYARSMRDGIPTFQPQSIQDAFDLLTMNDPAIPDVEIKQYLMDKSLPLIRRTLRSQGKTFVTKMIVEGGKTNAVNPMQPLMDRISAALNAPYYKGLAEELMAMGAVIPNPPDWSAVAASVSAWKDKLMNDGEGFDSPWAIRAKSLLGVQGYNDFINVYNNGTDKPSK